MKPKWSMILYILDPLGQKLNTKNALFKGMVHPKMKILS